MLESAAQGSNGVGTGFCRNGEFSIDVNAILLE